MTSQNEKKQSDAKPMYAEKFGLEMDIQAI